MKLTQIISLIVIACFFAGCGSGIEIAYDFDQKADFSTYRTFQWVTRSIADDGSAQTASQTNTLLENRIGDAVTAELQAKGLTAVTESPDLYVTYHAGTQDQVDVQSYGYGYGYGAGRYGGVYGGPYGAGGGGIDTYHYTEGTLIVDLIDATDKQLVWRGTGTAVLDDNPSPEKIDQNVKNAIGAILSNYPPK